jgi:DNA mismatch repair protein MutS
MLEPGRNNYLAAVVLDGDRAGLAYADITTGEFATTSLANHRLLEEELARLAPAEILLPQNPIMNAKELTSWSSGEHTVSRLPDWRFELGAARQTLLRHFGVKSLDAFGCEHKPLAARAAGAVLYYLTETQMGNVRQIQRLATYSTDSFMALGANAQRNLELTRSIAGEKRGTLLSVLDRTVTAMGARQLLQKLARPLLDLDQLNHRLDNVELFVNKPLLRAEIRRILRGLPDLERLATRVLSHKATPRDLEQMSRALAVVPNVRQLLEPEAAVARLVGRLDPSSEMLDLIRRAIVEDAPANLTKIGIIRPGFSAELDGVMSASAHARDWVAQLEPRERQRTGINSLKVGYNKVFGYYIEVTNTNAQLVPAEYVRKQTLTNAERYITPELKEYETLILNAEDRILQIERRIFGEVCARIAGETAAITRTAQALGNLDVAAALAEVAATQDYVRPVLTADTTLEIQGSRHPVVEQSLNAQAATGERFVPNDVHFDEQERILIITGPNMSGKSTYLRQVALVVLMAQIGSFVPATQAKIGLVDRIFTRIGAHDELHFGRSTFMVEMVETAEILNHATHRSLLVLDEIGRGTSTYDGLSLAWALVEYLHNHPRLKPRTLFATHYHELTGLADLLPMVTNYNVEVAEEGDHVVFLHRIIPGGADRSYGIHVAQLAGLPRDVITRADQILHELEKHAPTASVEPGRLTTGQQMALFPEASPILQELADLEVNGLTPLEAINKLFEWKRRYAAHS